MMILALFALQAASVVSPSAPSDNGDDTIVVTATRLKDTREAWEACLAKGCPPDKEMRAGIAYANALFLNGDFPTARQTLSQAQRRNDRYAKTYPTLVSDLARVNARVSSFDGQPIFAMDQTLQAVSTLKQGLASQDAIVMMQRLETGDQMARAGRMEAASSIYLKVARAAERHGLGAVRGHALFRDAVLISAAASVNPDYRVRARRAVAKIAADRDPAMAPFRDGLTQLSARIALLEDKHSDPAAAAKFSRVRSPDAVALLYEPLFDYQRSGLTDSTAMGNSAEWADVAFWVRPDGRVDDVEVRQTSDNKPGAWLPLKLKLVAQRRYTPFDAAPDSPGLYRVERYAMVHDMVMPTGTHAYIRSRTPRLETMDLSSTYRGKSVAVN